MAASCDLRVQSLADHCELLEQVGLPPWTERACGAPDSDPFIEVTAKEAGRSGQLPMTLAAIDGAGGAVEAVGLDRVDDELSAAERAGRAPWIVGMVVRASPCGGQGHRIRTISLGSLWRCPPATCRLRDLQGS